MGKNQISIQLREGDISLIAVTTPAKTERRATTTPVLYSLSEQIAHCYRRPAEWKERYAQARPSPNGLILGLSLSPINETDVSAFTKILLQKSFFADDQNSAGRGRDFLVQDVRDLAASRKIHRRLR
jgi:hypothetical protein